MSEKKVKRTLYQVRRIIRVAPVVERRALYERLRHKIGSDIMDIILESGVYPETIATMMGMSKGELKQMIWEQDLKLSELVKLLNKLDAEMYPLIRVRKMKGN